MTLREHRIIELAKALYEANLREAGMWGPLVREATIALCREVEDAERSFPRVATKNVGQFPNWPEE